jgi:ribosomal protein S18 acetylase RimI-like enzyme/catechol 2,3-dioxygenase-like lactoylglutathione lyase family enzyme
MPAHERTPHSGDAASTALGDTTGAGTCVHFILYVLDQQRSRAFYEAALGVPPRLHAPGMTEFALAGGAVLGLMPEAGIRRLLPSLPDPSPGGHPPAPRPRAETYLMVATPGAYLARAVAAGATELSGVLPRDWGHHAGYCLDPDGHVLAFACPSAGAHHTGAAGAEGGAHPAGVVRPYQASDEAEVVALWGLVFPDDPPWNDASEVIRRKLSVQRELFLVCASGGVVVGTVLAGFDGVRGWIHKLAVRPDQQRRGIGARLMSEAEDRLASLGCPKVNLQVRAGNERVVEFYRRAGYVVEDRVSMGKRLAP